MASPKREVISDGGCSGGCWFFGSPGRGRGNGFLRRKQLWSISLQRLPLPSQPFLCNLTSVGHTGSSHMGKKSGKPTDVSERKSSHVPGQYLGYALQPTRLLSLALDAAPGSSLSLEVFEDVGVEEGSGERLASQTKTARDSNPVSDRAIDLWKTFSNWLTAISKGELDPSKTCFEIYLASIRMRYVAFDEILSITESRCSGER
jgi:hypothetical protein